MVEEVGQEKGQSLVELALILPVLLMMLAGLMDFGRALDAYIVITNAAREAARYASLNPTDTNGIIDRGLDVAELGGLERNRVSVTPTIGASGEPAIVQVTTQFDLILLDVVWENPITLSYTAQMIVY